MFKVYHHIQCRARWFSELGSHEAQETKAVGFISLQITQALLRKNANSPAMLAAMPRNHLEGGRWREEEKGGKLSLPMSRLFPARISGM